MIDCPLPPLPPAQQQAGDNGIHSQWHVASVDVLHKRSGKQTSFPIGAWIQADTPITVAAAGAARDVYQPYLITVLTSENTDASFDGDINLVLEGKNGATSYSTLLGRGNSSSGVFQVGVSTHLDRGRCDVSV